jgi:hypothetical protein
MLTHPWVAPRDLGRQRQGSQSSLVSQVVARHPAHSCAQSEARHKRYVWPWIAHRGVATPRASEGLTQDREDTEEYPGAHAWC